MHRPGGAAGAVGYLVGEPHAGLGYMFHMMNEARIGVGLGAAALGYTGCLHALDYARTRLQGRPVTDRDPAAPPVPIIEHTDVRRMLLAQKVYAEGGIALGLYCSRLVDEQQTSDDDTVRARASLLLDVLTPIAKSWPSQWCLTANDLAIQVLGGAGYTRDHPVEQFYRDNRLNPIHEGTHGIQALDLLGRKVAMNQGANLALLAARMGTTIARAKASGDGDLGTWASTLEASAAELVTLRPLRMSATARSSACGVTPAPRSARAAAESDAANASNRRSCATYSSPALVAACCAASSRRTKPGVACGCDAPLPCTFGSLANSPSTARRAALSLPPAARIRPAAAPSLSSSNALSRCSGVNCGWNSRIAMVCAAWMKPRARSVNFSMSICPVPFRGDQDGAAPQRRRLRL